MCFLKNVMHKLICQSIIFDVSASTWSDKIEKFRKHYTFSFIWNPQTVAKFGLDLP